MMLVGAIQVVLFLVCSKINIKTQQILFIKFPCMNR